MSEDVVEAVAQALRLDEDERTYLFDLARAARPARRAPSRRKDVAVPPRIQWLLDSMTMSSVFVRNGRQDVIAHNAPARALHAPVFDSDTTDKHGRPNIARYTFLDAGAQEFFVDWGRLPSRPAGCCARKPGASRMARLCASSSGNCPRSVPSSAAGGPRTTCVSVTTASSGCGIPRSASWS